MRHVIAPHVRAVVALLALTTSVQCSRRPSDAAGPVATPRADASQAPATGATAAPRLSASAPSDPTRRLNDYYGKFVDGSSFDFLREDWAARVERYLRLKDVPIDNLISEARAFYKDKRHVALKVQPASVTSRMEGGRSVVTFVLSMAWTQPAPPAAHACGHLDDGMQWQAGSQIDHKSDVNVEMTLDAAGKFVAYDEHGLKPAHLRVSNHGEPLTAYSFFPARPVRDLEPDAGGVSIPDGTVVDNLGDSFVCGEGGEVDTVEKVRFGGHDVWALSNWAASTGHSYVGENVLIPAP